jgi:HTH-type transcriptional regulator/antitoxin HigA
MPNMISFVQLVDNTPSIFFNKMKELKYTLIKSKQQYKMYCDLLENFVSMPNVSSSMQDEIELLTLLIEKWDQEHGQLMDLDPVSLLKSFMDAHQIKAIELSGILGISRGYMSDILHYKKGLSKEVIRKLSSFFKVRQDAFNRAYDLKHQIQHQTSS